jgi:hypothetical protein
MLTMTSRPTAPSIGIGLLLPVLGVVTVALALLTVAALRPGLPDDAPTATARVVKYDQASQNSGTRWIEVTYTGPGGRQVTARTVHFRSEDPAVGREVQIRYDPEHPNRVAVAGATNSWLSNWIYVIVAAACELLILFAVIRRLHQNRLTSQPSH